MHDAFAQFSSIRKDAEDSKAAMATKLTMPVLIIRGIGNGGPQQNAARVSHDDPFS